MRMFFFSMEGENHRNRSCSCDLTAAVKAGHHVAANVSNTHMLLFFSYIAMLKNCH